MKRSGALLEAVVAIGITTVVIAGATLLVGRAGELEQGTRTRRALDRLESGLTAAIEDGWRRSRMDFAAEQEIGFLVEYEGVVSLILVDENTGAPRELPEHLRGLVGGFRPVGRIITAPERLVDAFGVESGAPPGPTRASVVEPLDESEEAGIPPSFAFSWDVDENLPFQPDLAEVSGPLRPELTELIREATSMGVSDADHEALGGAGPGNENGVLERPLRGPAPPPPLLLPDAQLTAITDPARVNALRAWFAERLGRDVGGASLVALAAAERRALARRRLRRDQRDAFRQLGWRVEGAAFDDPPTNRRLRLQLAAYGDVIARRSGSAAEPLRVWEVVLEL